MRIGNVEFGTWNHGPDHPRMLRDFFELDYMRGGCDEKWENNCTILTIGPFYFTILRGDCRKHEEPEYEKTDRKDQEINSKAETDQR